jgi:1,4-alpha-glucan branching enzyme
MSPLLRTQHGDDDVVWAAPKVAAITNRAREAELRALAAGPGLSLRAARELLALQASDWAFLEFDDLAGPYPMERFGDHLENFNAELASVPLGEAALRNLAPTLSLAPLLEP